MKVLKSGIGAVNGIYSLGKAIGIKKNKKDFDIL